MRLLSRNAPENPPGIETLEHHWKGSPPSKVATHQKTRQGLKLIPGTGFDVSEKRRNAPENPPGIETIQAGLLFKPQRSRNAPENPPGIETYVRQARKRFTYRRNAPENPPGIETRS